MSDPHVKVPDEIPYLEVSVATPAVATFDVTWTFFAKADFRVVVNGVELEADDFEVVGNSGTIGGFDGGQVILDVPAENALVQIWSDITPARLSDFIERRRLSANAINTELDRIWARMRDTKLRMQRFPVFRWGATQSHVFTAANSATVNTNEGAGAEVDIVLPAPSTGLFFIFVAVDAEDLVITVDGGGQISDAGQAGTQIATAVAGATLCVMAISDTTYVVMWKNGAWTVS